MLFASTACLANCGDGETAVDQASDLAERCWEFVDTGDFPSRGLFWVRGTSPIATYDDRGAKLRVKYAAIDLNDLWCGFSNHETGWSKSDRDAVFDVIRDLAPNWIATRNGVETSDIKAQVITDGAFRRHLVFGAVNEGDVYLAIHEEEDTGFVGVLIGRGFIVE